MSPVRTAPSMIRCASRIGCPWSNDKTEADEISAPQRVTSRPWTPESLFAHSPGIGIRATAKGTARCGAWQDGQVSARRRVWRTQAKLHRIRHANDQRPLVSARQSGQNRDRRRSSQSMDSTDLLGMSGQWPMASVMWLRTMALMTSRLWWVAKDRDWSCWSVRLANQPVV
jgi:hypothetical protein